MCSQSYLSLTEGAYLIFYYSKSSYLQCLSEYFIINLNPTQTHTTILANIAIARKKWTSINKTIKQPIITTHQNNNLDIAIIKSFLGFFLSSI